MTASTGVTNGVMRYKISEPGAHRIGISLASGVFSLISSDGSDLTFNNAGFITLKSITPGILKEYFLTANQSFNDATSGSGSDITGALFGYPTGVALTDDVIFTGYAVVNDAETALAIMIGVDDTLTSAPANTLIGTPSSPTAASTSGSLFSFTDVTTTDYENNPLVPIFRMRMRMDVNDDWTVQTLNNSDGMIPPGEWLPITIETDSGTATMYQRKFSFLGSGDASTSASGNGVIVDSTSSGGGGTPSAGEIYFWDDFMAVVDPNIDPGRASESFLFLSIINGIIGTDSEVNGDIKVGVAGNTSAAGQIYNSGGLGVGNGEIDISFYLKVSALSDATNRYVLYCGLGNNTGDNSEFTNGCYFKYSDNINSGNFQVVTANGGVRTANNTADAPATSYDVYRIVVNAAGSSVSFYKNGVEVSGSPITTNIPSTTYPFIKISRLAGTATRYAYLDYYTLKQILTTPRS